MRDGGAESKQTSGASHLSGFSAEDVRHADRNSGSDSLVAMMKAAEDRDGDDLALVWPLDFPGDGAVAIKRSMGPSRVVVVDILGHDALEVALSKDDHVVEAVLSDGPDHSFAIGISIGTIHSAHRRRFPISSRHRPSASPTSFFSRWSEFHCSTWNRPRLCVPRMDPLWRTTR